MYIYIYIYRERERIKQNYQDVSPSYSLLRRSFPVTNSSNNSCSLTVQVIKIAAAAAPAVSSQPAEEQAQLGPGWSNLIVQLKREK